MLWFEKFDDGMDWPIESSAGATAAFAAGIANPVLTGQRVRRPARERDPSPELIEGGAGRSLHSPVQPDADATLHIVGSRRGQGREGGRLRAADPRLGRMPAAARRRRGGPVGEEAAGRGAEEAAQAPRQAPPDEAAAGLLGRLDRRPPHGRQAAPGHAAVSAFERMRRKGPLADPVLGPVLTTAGTRPCTLLRLPHDRDEHDPQPTARSPSSAGARSRPGARAAEPTHPADFQLSDVIGGRLRRLHPRIRRSERAIGGSRFFLRFNWEMNGDWFPWWGRRQRQPAGRVRRRLAPRPRHLHAASAPPTRPGSGARTSR